jgi:hypothetical protein
MYMHMSQHVPWYPKLSHITGTGTLTNKTKDTAISHIIWVSGIIAPRRSPSRVAVGSAHGSPPRAVRSGRAPRPTDWDCTAGAYMYWYCRARGRSERHGAWARMRGPEFRPIPLPITHQTIGPSQTHIRHWHSVQHTHRLDWLHPLSTVGSVGFAKNTTSRRREVCACTMQPSRL